MQGEQMNNLNDLLIHDMQDLLSAENMLGNELPKLANMASNNNLKQKLQQYGDDAKNQTRAFHKAFDMLGAQAKMIGCKGMQGIIDQANENVNEIKDPNTKDAAIIAEVQKMKHYEIASYGSVRTWADMLGKKDVANMMADTLHEEEQIDRDLTALAMNTINPQAKAA